MKEKQRKIMGLIISFVMIITIMPQTIWASDAGTREDAVKWAYAQEGKFLDYDKVYGAQCVDLVHYYYAYFGKASYATGNGCDFVNNKLPDGWTRIKNTPDFVPQPGDIAVWGKELSQYGHVAIILSADAHSFVSMDQNWPRGSACKKVTHNYNKFWGVIRPNFSEPPSNPPTYSKFWIDGNFYDLSGTITFNVTASMADRFAIGIDKIGVGRVVTEGCGSTYSISADRLGTGNYSAYMSVANSAGGVDTYRVGFIVAEKSKYLDIGTNFIANIIRTDSWSHVVNNNTNACIGQKVGNANENWYFQKQDDGSYTIRSMEDGKYLDVSEAGNRDGLNVYCYDYTGADNQRWFIKQGTNGLILVPKCAINSCLDIANGFTAVGTNAWLWTQNGTAAQEFNVYKEDTIKLGTANVTLSNNNYIYDGKEKKPDVTVKYGYATLQQGTDYTVEYSNNVKAGTATVTIKGTGIYSGTVSKNFEIKEALYTVYGYQVVINGNFDLKYYIDLSKEAANDTDTYIEFKVGDRVQKVKQRETSNGHYVYTCEVPVAQIGDKVTATLHYKDKSYALTQYSVKDYLNTIVQNKDKKEEYGKAADIASAILNYGARAQLYFGYKTDSLVNSALPDAEIKKVDSILAQDIKNAITNKESGNFENNDFKYYGASLVCKSDTGMKLYFENKNSLSLKEIEKKYDISVKDCKKQISKSINGNMICITINDLNATELDDNFVVQITNKQNSSQSMSVSTSPYMYIKKSMDSGNTKLINLSKAMYWYSQKAMEYSMMENR